MNRSILIFIKAPVPGFVKTRLSPDLSPAQAAELYMAMAQDTLKVALGVPKANVVVAFQSHPDMKEPTWLMAGQTLDWFPQEGKDLGERLEHATHKVFENNAGPLLVIGSDLPGLTISLMEKAFGLLRMAPVVLGPSEDGGYYLIGLQEPKPVLFQGIQWSEPSVLEQTIARIRSCHLVHKLLPRRADLDTTDDLRRLRSDPSQVNLGFLRTRAVLRGF